MSKRKKDIQPYWRPNFVVTGTLPDIKAIRTDFIVNIIAVTLFSVAAFFLVQREYRIFVLQNTISDLQQQIRVAEPENNANLKLSREFREAAETIIEVERFFLSPVLAHDFLYELTKLQPEEIIFNEVSFRELVATEGKKKKGVTYRMLLSGEVRSLTTLDAFKGKIENWELLAVDGYELAVEEVVEGRDAATNIFPYRLNITLAPAADSKEKEDS